VPVRFMSEGIRSDCDVPAVLDVWWCYNRIGNALTRDEQYRRDSNHPRSCTILFARAC